jgi:hypothetical protein
MSDSKTEPEVVSVKIMIATRQTAHLPGIKALLVAQTIESLLNMPAPRGGKRILHTHLVDPSEPENFEEVDLALLLPYRQETDTNRSMAEMAITMAKRFGVRLASATARRFSDHKTAFFLAFRPKAGVAVDATLMLADAYRGASHTSCDACGKTPTKLLDCGGCRAARYCNRPCQLANREFHRPFCVFLSTLVKRAPKAKKEETPDPGVD